MIDINELHNKFLSSSGVSTDTRKISKDSMFFALIGENFDGNKYAKDAIKAGAKYAVVDNSDVVEGENFLLVDNVLIALQELAKYHRLLFDIPIIGLTGSNGKTTTKELTREVLSKKYKVVATEGNLNNHIGVPLTLLRLTKETELGIIEMGANHVGEIAALCEIAQPTHGLITNIGKAHLEGFGGIEGVIRGKSELYNHLINEKGVIFINSDDKILMNMSKRMDNPVFYNNSSDYYHCQFVSANPYVKLISEDGVEVETKLIGRYNFKNITVALCIGKYFKVESSSANGAITEYLPQNNRSQIINTKTNQIILDAYNANPVSMMAALENIEGMDHPKKVVILGDMFELGDDSSEEHMRIVNKVDKMNLSQAILCGTASHAAAQESNNIVSFETKNELTKYIKDNPHENALILIKASRGMGLETLVDSL